MKDELDVERTVVKKRFEGKGIKPEKYGMVFCSNCSGSGKYFYGNSGISACQDCGGFGLIRMERNWTYGRSYQGGLLLD